MDQHLITAQVRAGSNSATHTQQEKCAPHGGKPLLEGFLSLQVRGYSEFTMGGKQHVSEWRWWWWWWLVCADSPLRDGGSHRRLVRGRRRAIPSRTHRTSVGLVHRAAGGPGCPRPTPKEGPTPPHASLHRGGRVLNRLEDGDTGHADIH